MYRRAALLVRVGAVLVAIAVLFSIAHEVFVMRMSTIREQVPTLFLMAAIGAVIYWYTAEVLGLSLSKKGKVVSILGAGGLITFGGFLITNGGLRDMTLGGLAIIYLGVKLLLVALRHK